jgi:Zn-dependent protease with chaperone function
VDTTPEVESVSVGGDRPAVEYFSGPAPRVRLSAGYKVGLFVVALGMVLLPLIYVGIIGSVGWGMWWWATHAVNWFFSHSNSGGARFHWMIVLAYISPLVVGLMLLLFMIKSLFSRWRVHEYAVPISHEDHPEIFRFLGQLCRELGAPIPSRVDVTMAVNASAGFRAGFASMFGNDIMLTFGLPLVAGLDCREFAGVMAHELGHFTQRTAMRFGYIIHTVNGWLYRAAFQRDEFEYWLEEATEEGSWSFLVFGFARLFILITRGIMWLLFLAGYAMSSYMSRQKEFHADACAVAVAGTEGFLGMQHKILLLSVSSAQAGVQFQGRVAPKLPDDWSTYIAMLSAQCGGEFQGKVLAAEAKKKTRWDDSHPADVERSERARRANEPGIIQDSRPATVLFNNFRELSRDLTLGSYLLMRRGEPVPETQLFAVEPAQAEAVLDTSPEETAIKSYFGGLGLIVRPVLLGTEPRLSFGMANTKLEQLRQAREFLQQPLLAEYRESLKQVDATMLQAIQANALLQAGVMVDLESFPLCQCDLAGLPDLPGAIHAAQEQLGRAVEPFDQAAGARLLTALSLLRTPEVTAVMPNTQQLQDEVIDLLHVFGRLGAVFPSLLELRREFAGLQTLLDARPQNNSELMDAAVSDLTRRVNEHLARIRAALGSVAYPFEHVKGRITIADYAQGKTYDPDPALMAASGARSHLEMLFALYHRVLGRLIAIATEVEQHLEAGATVQRDVSTQPQQSVL